MSIRSRILVGANLVLSTGLFVSLLAGRSNSHLVLPIVIVTCSSYGLVYAVGFEVISKWWASALLGSVLAYAYLGSLTSIWAVSLVFAIFLLLCTILYLANVGHVREKMSSRQSEHI